jgi:hypothetical protein
MANQNPNQNQGDRNKQGGQQQQQQNDRQQQGGGGMNRDR